MITENKNNRRSATSMMRSIAITAMMLLTSLFALPAMAQDGIVVSGTVSDAMGPIMMANVVEVDASNRIISSVTTDINGNFSFKVKNPKNKLKFSFVGCKTKVVPIKAEPYDIVLEDQTTLQEVTVTSKARSQGSGLSIPEDELSIAGQTISMKEFEGLAMTSVDEALQGRIAGLDIVGGGGSLGSGSSMRLRGASTLSENSNPLIVVDGNVMDTSVAMDGANEDKLAELLNINPDDIESISVLKDAAATAIWGSQGANGVLEIKTKRGKRGKTRTSYSYLITATWQPNGYRMLNGDEYTMLMKEALFNRTLNSQESQVLVINYDETNPLGWHNWDRNTDWLSEVKKVGVLQKHNLSLTGGGEKANFRIGIGYDTQTGTLIEQKLDRLSTRVALDYFVSDRIKIVTNLSFTYTKKNQIFDEILGIAYQRMPNSSIHFTDNDGTVTDEYYNIPNTGDQEKDQNGQLIIGPFAGQNGTRQYNPVALVNLAKKKESTYKISPEFKLQYNILSTDPDKTQLRYEGQIYFDVNNQYNDNYYPSTLNVEKWNSGNMNKTYGYSSKSLGITTTHTLTFTPHFKNEDHSLSMMLRGQLNSFSSNNQTTEIHGLPNGTIQNTASDGQINNLTSYTGESRSIYFTYSAHYAYKSRYMADFSIRRDGSTKFGPGNRWGNFPAFSLRWNISNEPFVKKNLPWLSMLSVRPGWGMVGEQPGKEYMHHSRYQIHGGGYMNTTYATPQNIQLKELRWAKKTTYNIGLDLGVFQDKVTGNIEFYKQYTSDLLMASRSIPTSAGFSSLDYDNVGKMENTGWEFNINTSNLVKIGKLGIDFNVTFANNRNLITEMDESCLKVMNRDFNRGNPHGDYLSRVEVGKPLGSIFGFRYLGTYQYSKYSETEVKGVSGPNAPVVRDINGNVVKDEKGYVKEMRFCYEGTEIEEMEFHGGDAKYDDINHDGQINELDIVYLGSSLPKFTGGFGIKFKFGNFTLNNQFNFRFGHKIINKRRWTMENMRSINNQSRATNWRWRVEGDVTEIPRALYNYGYNDLASDRFVEDGSNVRLNYTQLSYNFPQKFVKKLGLSSLSCYISANNVFCITKYSGSDPDVAQWGYSPATDNSVPRSKSVTGGLTVQF